MDETFRLLVGHGLGDYLLASQTMQTKKGQAKGIEGTMWCMLHCLIYTGAICLCLWHFSWLFAFLIFNTHFWVDRFSLAEKWAQLTGGRTFAKAVAEPDLAKRPFSIAFTCIVYAVSDNMIHLLLMWWVLSLKV